MLSLFIFLLVISFILLMVSFQHGSFSLFFVSYLTISFAAFQIYRMLTIGVNYKKKFKMLKSEDLDYFIQTQDDATLTHLLISENISKEKKNALMTELKIRDLLSNATLISDNFIIDKGHDQNYALLILTEKAILQIHRITPKPPNIIRTSDIQSCHEVHGSKYQAVGFITLSNIVMNRMSIRINYLNTNAQESMIYVSPNTMRKWENHLKQYFVEEKRP